MLYQTDTPLTWEPAIPAMKVRVWTWPRRMVFDSVKPPPVDVITPAEQPVASKKTKRNVVAAGLVAFKRPLPNGGIGISSGVEEEC
jgi:hypothetical protein